jgi:hypothetical protein
MPAKSDLDHAWAAADDADGPVARRWLESGDEFLVMCGALALGRLHEVDELRPFASDPRPRVRDAVVAALQRVGQGDMPSLIGTARQWASGGRFEQRAAVAAVCHPSLLRDDGDAATAALSLLDGVTASFSDRDYGEGDGRGVLDKALGSCWCVAVAAAPEEGKPLMGKWIEAPDPEIRRIMRRNLGRSRLARLDPDWVEASASRLEAWDG